MNLSMIKEAQIASTMDKSELAALEQVKAILGEKSIHSLLESFSPSPEDYNKWLSVIVGHAQDVGASLNKKSSFQDLAFDVLDNDPAFPQGDYDGTEPGEQPQYELQELIVNKLWRDYQAAKHGARIEKVAQRHQEEEEIAATHAAMTQSCEEEEDDEPRLAFGQRDWEQESETRPYDGYLAYRAKGGRLSRDQWEFDRDQGAFDGEDDEDEEMTIRGTVDVQNPSDQEDLGASDGDNGAETIDAIAQRLLQGGEAPDEEDDTDENAFPKFIRSQQMSAGNMANEEEESTSKQPVEQPKNKTTFLQQMLRGPRDNLTQALKDVESEGEAAWKAHQIPDNPHPKKSMAHKAWERGMKKAVKGHFGFEEKPAVNAGKQKKK